MDVLTAAEVAKQLRVGKSTAYKLFASGELLGYKVGRSVRFYAGSVADFVSRSENPPAASVVPIRRRPRVVPVLVRRR